MSRFIPKIDFPFVLVGRERRVYAVEQFLLNLVNAIATVGQKEILSLSKSIEKFMQVEKFSVSAKEKKTLHLLIEKAEA